MHARTRFVFRGFARNTLRDLGPKLKHVEGPRLQNAWTLAVNFQGEKV